MAYPGVDRDGKIWLGIRPIFSFRVESFQQIDLMDSIENLHMPEIKKTGPRIGK